jgi:hypothetical protein
MAGFAGCRDAGMGDRGGAVGVGLARLSGVGRDDSLGLAAAVRAVVLAGLGVAEADGEGWGDRVDAVAAGEVCPLPRPLGTRITWAGAELEARVGGLGFWVCWWVAID